jgi:hypothetical protein
MTSAFALASTSVVLSPQGRSIFALSRNTRETQKLGSKRGGKGDRKGEKGVKLGGPFRYLSLDSGYSNTIN